MSGGREASALSALWHGAGLSALFFLPLVQALESNRAFLLWQPRHTAEFAVAYLGLALIFAVALYVIDRFLPAGRRQLAALVLLCALPLASAGAAIARQFSARIDPVRAIPRAGFAALTATVVLLAALAVIRAPGRSLKVMRATLLALSPASVIVLLVLAALVSGASSPASHGRDPAPGHVGDPQRAGSASVYVFLFDELSFRFVYRDGRVRSDLPHLRRLSETSTNYLAAAAPDDRTITSVPGLLAARDMAGVELVGDEALEDVPGGGRVPLDLRAPGGLFSEARAAGLRTEMIGYYLPYCRLLDGVADTCVSYSWYNYSTLSDRFSPFAPVVTNLILWPYQPPFGALKVPALSALQRQIVERTTAAAAGSLGVGTPRFRFVHFSIPHLPFVFDGRSYRPAANPMDQSAANYERQLQYTDTVVGRLIDRLAETGVFEQSAVVVTSDHEFRWPPLGKPESAHVPLIVKRPGQRAPQDVPGPVRSSAILHELVTASARVAPAGER